MRTVGRSPTSYSRERQALATWYPGFRETRLARGLVWVGSLRPLPGEPRVNWSVLGALARGLVVNIGVDGSIEPGDGHRDDLPANVRAAGQIGEMSLTHEVAVGYLEPGGGFPKIFSLRPAISAILYPDHPHLYLDDSLCVLFPQDGDWVYGRETIADYLDQTSMWLVKHAVWKLTGTWIGAAVMHRAGLPRDPARRPTQAGRQVPDLSLTSLLRELPQTEGKTLVLPPMALGA